MNRISRSAWKFVAIVLTAVSALVAAGADWPQWRGPGSQGVSPETGLPIEWSPTKNVAWKTEIPGRGHSSPVVWAGRVFLTTDLEGPIVAGAIAAKHTLNGEDFVHPESFGADRAHTFKVLCLDSGTGKVLWERTVHEGTVHDDRHRKGSYAASTPVTDGRHVYTFFGSEGVYSHDFDGKPIWKASVGKLPTIGMGTGTSPVLFGGLLILQCDEDNGERSFITALDTETGREVWKAPRAVRVSWSTPVLVEAGGRTELVANGTELVIAYAPATGKELWRSGGIESNAIHTPLVGDGMIFVTGGYPQKRILALRAGGLDEASGAKRVVWEHRKGPGYVPSPILYEGLIYALSDRGVVSCVEARSGEVKYEGGRVPVPATFTASPIAFEGKVLLTSEDGDTFVLKAGVKHEVLGTNPIGEPIFASIAVSGRSLYLRGVKHLFCVRRQEA